jgi:hypothetical protein
MTRLALTLTAIGVVACAAAACSDSGNTLRQQPFSEMPNTSLPRGYSRAPSSPSAGDTIQPTPGGSGTAPGAGTSWRGYQRQPNDPNAQLPPTQRGGTTGSDNALRGYDLPGSQ